MKICREKLAKIVKYHFGEKGYAEDLVRDLETSLEKLHDDLSDVFAVCGEYVSEDEDAEECVGIYVIEDIVDEVEENAENAEIVYNTFMNVVDDFGLFAKIVGYDEDCLSEEKKQKAISKGRDVFDRDLVVELLGEER